MKALGIFFLCFICVLPGCSQIKKNQDRIVGGPCDRCDLMFEGIPNNLSWTTSIAKSDELGVPLIISGTIYNMDGKTPAPDVILYVYQTDITGRYTPAPDQLSAKVHGHLRGWIKTNANGRYQFETIRPASYPEGNAPQHIHPLVQEPNTSLYWIDEYLFEDDPLLTARERSRQVKRGGSGIIQLRKNEKGTWIGHRDIILGLNIPDYQAK